MSEEDDLRHMRRALALAAPGVGAVAPNPSVGCVIVKAGAVVGEGATHGPRGSIHAEEAAIGEAGPGARGATAYVTLEPCAERTSGAVSCAQRLIAAGVVRVVIAVRDPHPKAAGAGLEALRAAGISVEIGLCEAEARAINHAFLSAWRAPPQ